MLTDLHDIYCLIWTKSKGKHDISLFSVIMCQEIKKKQSDILHIHFYFTSYLQE